MGVSRKMSSSGGNLNRAQQVVVSLGAAAALLALGRAAENAGNIRDCGWFAYAPMTTFPDPRFLYRHPGMRLLMWLVLIGVWAALSLWLFRTPARESPIAPSSGPSEPPGRAGSEA